MATTASLNIAITASNTSLNRVLADSTRRTRRFANGSAAAFTSVQRSIRRLTGAFVGFTALVGGGALLRTADEFTNINNLLRSSGVSATSLSDAFSQIQRVAIGTRSDLENTARLFSVLTRNSESLNASQEQILQVTRTIQQAFALSGASIAEASGATRQLSQALASGTLRGEELNSVLENAPEIARLITTNLDINIGRLRMLAAEGRITSQVVFNSLLRGSERINQRFEETNVTFGGLGNIFRAQILPALGQLGTVLLPPIASLLESIATAAEFLNQNFQALSNIIRGGLVIGFALLVRTGVAALTAAFSRLFPVISLGQLAMAMLGAGTTVLSTRTANFAFNLAIATQRLFGFNRAIRISVGVTRIGVAAFRSLGAAIRFALGPVGLLFIAFESLISILDVGFTNTLRRVGNFFITVINYLTSGVNRLFNTSIPQLEQFNIVLADTADAVENIPPLTFNEVPEAIDLATTSLDSFQETLVNAQDTTARLAELGSSAFDGLSDSLTDFVTTGRLQIREFAADVIRQFIRIQIRSALATGLSGAGFGSVFGRQFGGPVNAGQPYLVGEDGPELFVPNNGGSIQRNDTLSSGGAVTYNINAVDARSFQQLVAEDPNFIYNVSERGRRQSGR